MAEPQARRYLTRARAKAEDTPEDKLPPQWKGQKAAEKRKAIAVTDTDTESSSASTIAPSSRVTRATKRTASTKIEGTVGAKAAPKRKYTKNSGGGAKKATVIAKVSAVAASKTSKKVAFNDDKENLVPLRRDDSTIRQISDDTDELMSSMGALSVKPIRVPSTKLRLPTTNMNVSSAFDPLPALSPSKARRVPHNLRANDDPELEDELSSPQPKLVAKPKRAVGPSLSTRGYVDATGAMDLKKPLDLSTSLLTSPARRPPMSPFKPTTANTPFSKSSAEPSSSIPKSSLASPARRPPASVNLNFRSLVKDGCKLNPKATTLGIEVPDLSKPSFRSPPKRAKILNFVKIDESEDELGIDIDSYMLGRSPACIPKKYAESHVPVRQILVSKENTFLGLNDTVPVENGLKEPTVSIKPPSPIGTPTGEVIVEILTESDMDADGDVDMEDLEATEALMNQIALSPTKYKSPTKGGSSYGFFSLEDDEDDELPESRLIGNPFSRMDIQPSERKTLFPQVPTSKQLETIAGKQQEPQIPTSNQPEALATKQQEPPIPIDPFLLTLGAPDNFIGIVESPSRKMTVPVKMHSIDDRLSEDEDEDGENGAFQNQLVTQGSAKRCSVIRPAGVLAGAVVFMDVYTSEGADASAAFVEALRGLGAKVLKNWNWNPNSTGAPGEGERKVGITHVVFKDGSPRTLQKVKDSKGIVLCVGVAWVTACEDKQLWVDEGNYPVDLDHVPRGGHRRRKSMEPKALTMTPGGSASNNTSNFSIKTPKFTSRKSFFPQTEILQKHADETNPVLMHNLMMARRKSMQFAPKIGSPLRRFTPISMD